MLHTLRQELSELAAELRRRDKIDAMCTSLRQEEQSLLQKLAALQTMLSREEADVTRLEKISATSILHSVLGNREARLEKEQQEACAAKLKHGAALRQFEDCRRQIAALARERESLADCDRNYRQVYDAICASLKRDTIDAMQLCELETRLSEAAGQLCEISEAIAAGKRCIDQLDCITKSLDSAEGWGTWDLIGGGLLSDIAKHNHLDEAQSAAEHLQGLLSRFRAELADVRLDAALEQVNVDGFLLFADYFFDGLFADWCVLSHIQQSQQNMTKLKEQLATALSRLETLHTMQLRKRAGLEQQLDTLVCGTQQ